MDKIQQLFDFMVGLGGPALMFIVILVLSLAFKVKFSKAFEGALNMAIALTAMSALISLLTSNFSPALKTFVKSTGINLSISDLGWPPLAVISWGSLYTIYFIFLTIIVNLILLFIKKTNTLNVDVFNLWNVSLLGIMMRFYSHSIVVASIFVIFVYTFILLNADVMKASIGSLLGYGEENASTSSHPLLLVAPLVLLFDKIIDKLIPFIDKYDFGSNDLNKKIGYWGSNFAIGAYLGIFIGLLGRQDLSKIFELAFIGGATLELFSIVGGWFVPAITPLSDGIEATMSKHLRGRKLNIGLDWQILAARPEVWAVTNILAPILLLIAMIMPGNNVMPLGGILMTVMTPALLVITRGKVLRMTIIGTILTPLFLWVSNIISECITSLSNQAGNLPAGFSKGQLFTAIDADPLEKLLAYVVGNTYHNFNIVGLIVSIFTVVLYILLFMWYKKAMVKRDNEYKRNDIR